MTSGMPVQCRAIKSTESWSSSRRDEKKVNTALSTKVVQKKAYATMPKGSLGNTQQISIKAQNPYIITKFL